MGRIKTKQVKRIGTQLFGENSAEINKSFKENKKFLANKVEIQSKKLRNIIAGYLVKLKKKEESLN